MLNCIFCVEENPEDALECFNCSRKPFAGMYLEEGFFEGIEESIKHGNVNSACEKLLEEYNNHTDIDYYDDETAVKIADILNRIFEQNPETFKHRFELSIMIIERGRFWQYPVHDEVDFVLKLVSDFGDEEMKNRLTEAIDNYNQ